jgi:hypothetical protein
MEQIARPSADITLRVAKFAALFCSVLTAAYAAMQMQPSAFMAVLLTSSPTIVVILWLQKDARRTGMGAVQDLGYFLCSRGRLSSLGTLSGHAEDRDGR